MNPVLDLDTQIATMQADESLGLHDLPRITSQQRVYLAARVSGMNLTAAAREAGCAAETGRKWEKDSVMIAHREHYDRQLEETMPMVTFGRDQAHGMYMKAYHMSATSAEMVKATDSLVKLHRLGEAPEREVPKNVTARELADLPLSELMRLAALTVDSLSPGDIEGEYVEITNE
jgi:hypothetical protein